MIRPPATSVAGGAQQAGTPSRPAPTGIDGVLTVDLVKIRARYDCFRPGCPQPVERPARGDSVKHFVAGIKTQHLATHHGEHR